MPTLPIKALAGLALGLSRRAMDQTNSLIGGQGQLSPVIITLLVLLGVGLLLALWLMYIYNGLVVAGNRFKNAFAQIDVQLKRRYELIPNLVEAVKGYMGHERQTLDA